MLRAHQGGEAKAMLHISVIHTVAQKVVQYESLRSTKDICCHYSSSVKKDIFPLAWKGN